MYDDLFADIRQSDVVVDRLRAELPALAAAVAADVGEPAEAIAPVVGHVLDALARPGRLAEGELARLRGEGSAAARAGLPVQAPIDRYLSTGWVVWAHARQLAPAIQPELLAALGAALLRAGDDAAAALAAGYSEAERHLAARAGATRRAIVDELLDSLPLDPAATARLAQRAALVGLDPATAYRLIAIRAAAGFEDGAAPIEEVTRVLARSPGRKSYLVAPRQGDLFVVLADPWPAAASLAEIWTAFDDLAGWWAVRGRPVAVTALGGAAAEARAGLDTVRRLGRSGELVPLASIALDRALAADQRLLAEGVGAWLDPLLAAPRGGEALVATVEAWLAAGQSVAGAARVLGLGERTVSYRLERIAALLDRPRLDADARLHLAAALLGRRLIQGPPA